MVKDLFTICIFYYYTTGVQTEKRNTAVNDKWNLTQKQQHPFNVETAIIYQLPEAGYVNLDIYNSMGQKIRTLVSQNQNAGRYAARWDGRDEYGKTVTSGIYICRLQTNRFSDIKKMLLIK